MRSVTQKQYDKIEEEISNISSKNRLKGSRVYLCGAMDRVPDGGVQWRESITPWLHELGINVIDPCNKPIDIAVEDIEHRELRREWKEDLRYDELTREIKLLRAIDLRFVDVSDFIIVYLDTSVHACGTYEEIFLANRQKKPVLIVCEGGVDNMPDWMFGVLPHQHFFNNWDELKTYIHYVHSCNYKVEHYKRWFFLDYDKL